MVNRVTEGNLTVRWITKSQKESGQKTMLQREISCSQSHRRQAGKNNLTEENQ